MSQFAPDRAYEVLAPPFRVSWQDVLDEWMDSFEKVEQQSMMDVYLDHVLDYRLQRRTRVRLDAARWFCLPIYPYMDEQLYTIYRSLPLTHLNAERAHLALLCDYKTGLENLPSSTHNLVSVPIYKEYRYRHLVHLARIVRQQFVLPLRTKWQERKGMWGFGHSILNPLRAAELRRLDHCQLFNWLEVQHLIERARRGAFVNRNALECLINAVVIDDFLFGSGLSGDRALKFLKTPQEIHFASRTA